jgi:hypothetical protein
MAFFRRPGQTEVTSTNWETAVKIPLVQVFWHFVMGVLGYGFYLVLVFLIREYALGMAVGVITALIAFVAVALTASQYRVRTIALALVGVIIAVGSVFEQGDQILDAVMWEHWQWLVVPIPLLGIESIFYGRYRFRGEAVDPHGLSPPRAAVKHTGLEYPFRWLIEALLEGKTP